MDQVDAPYTINQNRPGPVHEVAKCIRAELVEHLAGDDETSDEEGHESGDENDGRWMQGLSLEDEFDM